ncbi:MAG: hypothetical protein ORO03_01945 [Alphaproteobacteria bacterium]|nr:hypothetical protein [Alphaproteobacteria bacterium]
MHDFGAGVMLEIGENRGGLSQMVPFTRQSVPEVDLGQKIVWITLPNYVAPEMTEVKDDSPASRS